jgi:hypothetical protein
MNRLVLTALAIFAPTSSLSAQTMSFIRGTVTNEAARPIQHAQVVLDPGGASRQLRTDREGQFNFPGVTPGQHVVRVTWVGFAPEERQVEVGATGGIINVTLRRLTRLDTTVVTAKRTGIYGSVISMDSLLPVPGARVEIIGDRKADSTDSSGTFNFSDVKHGSYIVRIRHPFFDSRNFSVVVPVDGGTELDVVMERGRVSRDAHMEMFYREMDTRLAFRGINTALITREDLKGREKMTLDVAVQFAPEFARKSLAIMSDVCVFVDGVARPGATLRDFAPEDIEAVEFYGGPWRNIIRNPQAELRRMDPSRSLADRWPPRTPCGLPLTPGEAARSKEIVKVMFAVVWLRR